MNATASALLWCVVQVTILAIGATLVYLAARRLHPRAGAAAAGGALAIVLLLTALLASPWPRWSFSTADGHVARGATAAPTPTQAPAPQGDSPMEADRSSNAPRRADLDSPQLTFWTALIEGLNNPRPALLADKRASPWPLALGLLFAAGAFLSAARLVHGMATVRRLARRAHPINEPRLNRIASEMQEKLLLAGPVLLRESNELATPATVGWRKPVVLLPRTWRSWSDEELHAAIAHELAHIAGRDYAAWLIARLAVVAHFYHPLVRWLATRLQLEQELAADLTAASLIGDRKQYLHSLAALALATPPHRVAGPIRTLIPTRSLLVRRVEMLRTNGINRPRRPVVRYATFAVVALVGLAAAGLRGPVVSNSSIALAQMPTVQNEATAPAERISLELVPQDATFVVSARVAEIIDREGFQPLADVLDELAPPLALAENSDVKFRDIRELMVIRHGDLVAPKQRIVIRFVDPDHQQQLIEDGKHHGFKEVPGKDGFLYWRGSVFRELDAATLVTDSVTTAIDEAVPPLQNALPRWAGAWQQRKDQPVVAAVDIPGLRASGLRPEAKNLVFGVPLQMVAPIFDHTDFALATVELQNNIGIFATLKCDSAESAKSVSETVQALVVLLKNIAGEQAAVEQAAAQRPDANRTQLAVVKMIQAAQEVLNRAEVQVDGDHVRLALRSELTIDDISNLTKSLLPSVEGARQAARQNMSMNNLRQLALAMLNYESAYKTYPPAQSGGAVHKSEHPHSWRVAILPFLEQRALYDQYHFDEPWDSEANQKVLAQMPDIFRSPFDDPNSTSTSYFVFNGPGAIFDGEEATRIARITDGTSKTLLLVESKRSVPWTKPEDIPYAADQPVPQLGGWMPGQFLAACADGSARSVSTDIDDATLRLWITKADGQQTPELPRP